ncbi:DUF1803 domain-containing protein [Enterococcus plantarum]|uniref:DUF1803 domain-containing protein n=1 Tax=Enterococcus plantarum TaxID=1077675 RepID=UPI001A8C747D|nr:DUF1803 domain-containing protein [Enterococcus plantarum]
MKNVSYYFTSNKSEEELTRIISDPLFTRIVSYLSERKEQDVILRQIKANILTDKNLELYLDKLIKYNLIERANRRYTLTFPIFSQGESLTLPDSITQSFRAVTQTESISTDYFVLGEWLWSLLFQEEQDPYFFGIELSSKSLPIFRKREEGNDLLRFVSVYPEELVPLDLANYFNLLSRRQELPSHFEPLQNIIGDVDIHYFIPQMQKVLRAIKRNRTRDSKKNIFQEALLVTGDLKKNEENQLFLATPILDSTEPSEAFQLALDKLKTELTLLWEGIETNNQRLFYKQQLYSFIVVNYLPIDQNYIKYFK